MKIPESLRRVSWLRELHGLLLVAIVICVLIGVASVIAILAGQPLDIVVSSGLVLDQAATTQLPPGLSIPPHSDIAVRVAEPTGTQVALAAIEGAPVYVLTTTMLVLLWRLVGDARRTDPFTQVTARRLQKLGWLLIVGGPAAWIVGFMARFALSDTVLPDGPSATLDLLAPVAWFLVGFGMLAIGEVIRHGQVLRTEVDGLV